jgi:hypothetical protein
MPITTLLISGILGPIAVVAFFVILAKRTLKHRGK